jgi:hypothetical protein
MNSYKKLQERKQEDKAITIYQINTTTANDESQESTQEVKRSLDLFNDFEKENN